MAHHGGHSLLLSDLVVIVEVLVQVRLQLLVSLESQATIRALKLNGLMQFTNSNDVIPMDKER